MILIIYKRVLLLIVVLFFIQNVFAQWLELNSGITNTSFNSLFFVNKDTGYIGGGDIGSPSVILKTENGGLTWDAQYFSGCSGFFSVFFVNKDTGYIAGGSSEGFIFKTINGGDNWTLLYSNPTGCRFQTIFFTDANKGYSGGYGGLLKTNDGGNTWLVDSFILPNYVGSIFFPIHNIGYAGGAVNGIAGYQAKILKTIDGGDNWMALISFDQYEWHKELQTVFFIDSLKGWIGGLCYPTNCNFGRIFKTINGGATWDTLTTAFLFTINDIFFTNENIGYVVDDSGYIYKTKDAGNNWEMQYFANKSIKSIHCIDSNICYAVGDSGLILKTINGGVSSVKENKNNSYPFSARPNPFNNSTEIIFSADKPTNAHLYITNIYGITVKELINSRVSEEVHKVNINGNDLPSGIYFCILETECGRRQVKIIKM